MRVGWLFVLLTFAGCLGSDGAREPTTDAPPTDAASPGEEPQLSLRGCSELDYWYPVDMSRFEAAPLRVRPVDPAGRLATELINAIGCDNATAAGVTLDAPRGWYSMVSVEPHASLRIADVSTYVWITKHLGPDNMTREFFGPRLPSQEAGMALMFTEFARKPKAHADLLVTLADGSKIRAGSEMLDEAAAGRAGSMAAYVGSRELGLSLFRIDFSAYKAYARGEAVISHGPLGPAAAAVGDPVPASHSVDYDVVFTWVGETSA